MKKLNYQKPTTQVVQLKMVTRILSGSQSWPDPAQAPLNAERKGYGDGIPEQW